MNLEDKIEIVNNTLKGKRVAIGFSGGADSTLLAYLSSKAAEDTLAITVDNHLLPTGFMEHAKRTAETLGIRHETIDIDFYANEDFIKNDSKRCFSCREMMYSTIETIACENGFDFICDGNNISDLVCDRPGILITYRYGFNTPFIEARLTSRDIHEYLDKKRIPYSRSTTCLATRIPAGTAIDEEKIRRIGNSEDFISSLCGCEIVKVRAFEGTGIVEVDDIVKLLSEDKLKQIDDELKCQGFKKVCLNLSEIDDNEYIELDYQEGSFSYELPYTIDMESTGHLDYDNVTVHKSGLIEGRGFESHEDALDTFMEILTRIRRNI
jgi:uncharacterized protein